MESIESRNGSSEAHASSASGSTNQGQEYRLKRRLAKCSQSLKYVLARPRKRRRELVENLSISSTSSDGTVDTGAHLKWLERPEADVSKGISLKLESEKGEGSLGDEGLFLSAHNEARDEKLFLSSDQEGKTTTNAPAQPSMVDDWDKSCSAEPNQTIVAEGETGKDIEEGCTSSKEERSSTFDNSEGLSKVRVISDESEKSKSLEFKREYLATMESCCLQPIENSQHKPLFEALFSKQSPAYEASSGHFMMQSIPNQQTRDARQKCSMTVTQISVLKEYCLDVRNLSDDSNTEGSKNLTDMVKSQESDSGAEKSTTCDEEKVRSDGRESSSLPQLHDLAVRATSRMNENSAVSCEAEEPQGKKIEPSFRSVFCTLELPDKYLGRALRPEELMVQGATLNTSVEINTPLSKQQEMIFPDDDSAGEASSSAALKEEVGPSARNTEGKDPGREKTDIEKVQAKRSPRKKVNPYRKRMLFSPRKRSAAPRVLYSQKMPRLEEVVKMTQGSGLPLAIREDEEKEGETPRTLDENRKQSKSSDAERKESKSSDSENKQIASSSKSVRTASRERARKCGVVKGSSAPRSVKLRRLFALRRSIGWFPHVPSSQDQFPLEKPFESMKAGRRNKMKQSTYPVYPRQTIIRKLSRTKYWKKSLLEIIRRRKEDFTFHKPEIAKNAVVENFTETRPSVNEHSSQKVEPRETDGHSDARCSKRTPHLRAQEEQHAGLTNERSLPSPVVGMKHLRTVKSQARNLSSKSKTNNRKRDTMTKSMDSDSVEESDQEENDKVKSRFTDVYGTVEDEPSTRKYILHTPKQKLKLMRRCSAFLSESSDESQKKIASLLLVEIKKMERMFSNSLGSDRDMAEGIQEMGFGNSDLQARDLLNMTSLCEDSVPRQSEGVGQAPNLSKQDVQLEEVEITLTIAKDQPASPKPQVPVQEKEKTAGTDTTGQIRTKANFTAGTCISSLSGSAVILTPISPKQKYRKRRSHGKEQRAIETSYVAAAPLQRNGNDLKTLGIKGESTLDTGAIESKNLQEVAKPGNVIVELNEGTCNSSVSKSVITSTPTEQKRKRKKKRSLIGRRQKNHGKKLKERKPSGVASSPVQRKTNDKEALDVGAHENFEALDPSSFNLEIEGEAATTKCPINFANFLDDATITESENNTFSEISEIQDTTFSDMSKEGLSYASMLEYEDGTIDRTLEATLEANGLGEGEHLPEGRLEDLALTHDLREQLMRDLDLSSSFSPLRSERECDYFDQELGKDEGSQYLENLNLLEVECKTLAGENEEHRLDSQDQSLNVLTNTENVARSLDEREPCSDLVANTNAEEDHHEASTSQTADKRLQEPFQNPPGTADQGDNCGRREPETRSLVCIEDLEENGTNGEDAEEDQEEEGERNEERERESSLWKDQNQQVGKNEKDSLSFLITENSNTEQDLKSVSDSDCEDVLSIYAKSVGDLDSDLETAEPTWKEEETVIFDENPDSALQPWEHHVGADSPMEDTHNPAKDPESDLSDVMRTANDESACDLVIALSEEEEEEEEEREEEEEESTDEDSRWFLGRKNEVEIKPKSHSENRGEVRVEVHSPKRKQEEVSLAQSIPSVCGKRMPSKGSSGGDETQKRVRPSRGLEDKGNDNYEMEIERTDALGIDSRTRTSTTDGRNTVEIDGRNQNQMRGTEIVEMEVNKGGNLSTQIAKPVKPIGYCHKAVDRGWCDRSMCRFRHEMSKELETYYSHLVLHYVSQGKEHLGWKVLGFNIVTVVNNPYLKINILMPLARHLVLGTFRDVKVPSHITPLLDISKLRALCEAGKGSEAYKLLSAVHTSLSSYMQQLLLREFVGYCEFWPEREAVTPWEKVQLWKYEGQQTSKDLLDISWLDFYQRQRNVDMVCRAYDYLCQSVQNPSPFFTYITCSVINFLNEMGEREKSFCVLKQIRRVKAKDPKLFGPLVPPDKETAKRLTAEIVELVQFVCEEQVPLPESTFTLLINAIRSIDRLALTVDLIICAIKVCQYDPEVPLLEILILDSIRKFPQLLWPVSNLVTVLPAKSLVVLIPTLKHVIHMLHFEPPPAQQVEENIIRYCHSKGVRLYQDPAGQFARRGRGKFVRASPSGPPRASGMGTPVKDEVGRHSRDGSQGHQEAFCKDGNVPHTSQPSRCSIGNSMLSLRNQGRNGPGTAKNERVPLLPSLVKKKQKSAPSTLQLQNNLQKPLSLGQKNSRNVHHDYQNSSAMADAPRPSPPKPPQVQMVPGFLGSNSLPPGFKIRFIGWPNVERTLTMNSKDQFIQESETQDKGIDNATVKGLSHWSQTDMSQKAEMSDTIREDRGKMQRNSSEMSKAEISACKFPFVSTEERDTSKDILSNKTSSTVASSRSKLNSWGFMMPKSRKGLPVNGTTAKEGSEKPSALDGNVPSNCLMESMSTVQGSYEIDLQGVPNQGLVSEDRAATRTHHVETRSYHQQNKWTESEQMEMDPIATLANELRVVTEVKAEQGTDILTAAEEEVFGELGVSLMVECFERHCAEAAVSVISLLLDYDILVYTYLPLQNEVPPSEHRLAVMALDLLHLRGQWDSFMKILEEVYWSGGSTEVRTKLKCLSVVLQTLLTSSGSCDSASHFARLQNAVKILASLVKYYRYDVQMIRDDYTRIIDLNNILIKTWQMINDSQVPTLMMEAKSLVLEAKSVGIKVPLEVEETARFYDMERQENGSLHAKGGTKKMHQEETGIKGERIYKNQRRPQQPDCAMSRGALWKCNQEVGMHGGNCKQGSAMLCRDTQGKSFLQGRTCMSLPATGTTSRWDLLHERGASMTVCLQGNKDGNIARNVVMHGQERFGIESQNQSQTPVPGKYTVGGGSFRNRQAYLPPPDDVQAHRMKIAMPSRPLGMVKGQSAGRVPTPHTSGGANQQRSEVLGKNSKRFRKVKHKGSKRPLMRQALEAD